MGFALFLIRGIFGEFADSFFQFNTHFGSELAEKDKCVKLIRVKVENCFDIVKAVDVIHSFICLRSMPRLCKLAA